MDALCCSVSEFIIQILGSWVPKSVFAVSVRQYRVVCTKINDLTRRVPCVNAQPWSGLITMAIDTTDDATNSNSLLPVLPRLGISGQCSGSLPTAAADDDDGCAGGLQD